MTDNIEAFYPRLAELPEIRAEMQGTFGQDAGRLLDAMSSGKSLERAEDDVRDLIVGVLAENAVEISKFHGSGQADGDHEPQKEYFREHHPEVAELMNKMTDAVSYDPNDFRISVLRYNFLHIVTAVEFDDEYFDSEDEAVAFAQSNYAPFIENYERRQKL